MNTVNTIINYDSDLLDSIFGKVLGRDFWSKPNYSKMLPTLASYILPKWWTLLPNSPTPGPWLSRVKLSFKFFTRFKYIFCRYCIPMVPTCRPGKTCGLTCCNDGQVCKSNMFCQDKDSSSSSSEEDRPCRNDNDCSRFERCSYPIFRAYGLGICVPKWHW